MFDCERNDICLCGSERKYKKCCLPMCEQIHEHDKIASIEENRYIGSTISCDFLYNRKDDFKVKIKELPIITSIKILSMMDFRLNEVNYNDMDFNFNKAAINDLLVGTSRFKANYVLESVRSIVFVSSLNILTLFKYLLISSQNTDSLTPNEKVKYEIGEVFLGMNDFPELNIQSKGVDNNEELVSLEIRDLMFRNEQRPDLVLARYHLLFNEIPRKIKTHKVYSKQYIDLDKIFYDKYAISLHVYIAFIFALYGAYSKRLIVNEDEYFNKLQTNPDIVRAFFNLVRLNLDNYKSKIIEEMGDSKDITYKLVTIKNFPLINVGGDIYCISRKSLMQKLSVNLYWQLFDACSEQFKGINGVRDVMVFTRYFGILFEVYIIDLLQVANIDNYKANIRVKEIKKQSEKSEIDLLLYDHENVGIVSIKSSRLNRNTLEQGGIESFKKDLKKTYGDCAEEMKKCLKCFFNNEFDLPFDITKIKRVFPIYLFLEPLPQERHIYKYYAEIMGQHRFAEISATILEPTIIDSEEFEISLNLIKENKIFDVLSHRVKDEVFKKMSYKNYLHAKKIETPRIDNLSVIFEKYFKQIKDTFETAS